MALSIGDVSDDELSKAGKYGAAKVLKAGGDQLKTMNVQPYATIIAQAAKAENAKIVVMSASFPERELHRVWR